MITGLFTNADSAQRAWAAVRALGYDEADINVLMSDETRQRHFAEKTESDPGLGGKAAKAAEKPGQGSELGGPAGGAVGTVAPVLAAVGTLALVPGILLAGPVAIALAAAGAVGVAGGLIGALADWGIPKDSVHEYEDAIRAGGIVLGVKPRSDENAARIEKEWRAAGGQVTASK